MHNPRDIQLDPRPLVLRKRNPVPRKKEIVSKELKDQGGEDYTNAMKVQDLLADPERLDEFAKLLTGEIMSNLNEYLNLDETYRPYTYNSLAAKEDALEDLNFVARMKNEKPTPVVKRAARGFLAY